ncbi:M23 family metallopeptidase [Amycolatopsis sp. RTGN1]|uniref:M23 family metallopeptidase n=1 Tax=Amycolatopsis ponsaeliensis TaxID=2992142 RepID=UPI00254CB5C4|nr:M23 family metallopeptidase [Amycolatopsis sp. RTGN1]
MTKLHVRGASLIAAIVVTAGLAGVPDAAAEVAPFPAFALPFKAGQQVYSAGIHSDDGSTGVKNAIDFSPADKTVRAPLAGTVHLQHCAGGDWVTIDHDGGWRTGYYHMEGIEVTDGEHVEAGAELGSTGNALPCGGSSTGAHVHFTLWTLPDAPAANWDGKSFAEVSTTVAAASGEPVDGKTIGGWRFTAGAEQYTGTATHLADNAVTQLPGHFRAKL